MQEDRNFYTHNEMMEDAKIITHRMIPDLISHAIFLHNFSFPQFREHWPENNQKKAKERFILLLKQYESFEDNLHSPEYP